MNNSFVQDKGYSSSGSNFWFLANRHQCSRKHIDNHTAYQLLGNVDIAYALDEARRQEVEIRNKQASRYSRMLKHHVDAAIFLSAQGLAFRGHDESTVSSNRGNFIELLDLLGNYSNDFKAFLNEKRATYTSHGPKNELIECLYHEVRDKIQRRVEKSRFLAVMMDDTSDLSNIEKSAVSVRLTNDGEVQEHLLGLVDCSVDQSADGLTEVLLNTLRRFNVTPETAAEKLIGQSYDGAPAMSGEFRGVQRQVQYQFPYALYNHCVAHRMALCAAQSANKVPKVAIFFKTVDKLVRHFRSNPKRTEQLGRSLPKPGDTRWLSRDTAVSVMDNWYETIDITLHEIANDANEKMDMRTSSSDLCTRIQKVDIVFLLKLYRKQFEHCTPIITVMQQATIDAVQLQSMITDFKSFLSSINLCQIWEDAMDLDPYLPVIPTRSGWRGIEESRDGSVESWKSSLFKVAAIVTKELSEQVDWRYANIGKFLDGWN